MCEENSVTQVADAAAAGITTEPLTSEGTTVVGAGGEEDDVDSVLESNSSSSGPSTRIGAFYRCVLHNPL
jgi:hypothetical protein